MKENLTQIVFILDRSGSMNSLTKDTIGGFNSFVEAQKKEDGEAILTTVLFDDQYEILHNSVNIQDVEPLTQNDYYARGMTALLDAVGKTINSVGGKLSKMDEADRPGKVIFVITTDGCENSSKEFRVDQIKYMIEHQKSKYNWEFIFLGANIDAVGTAKDLGINLSANYSANSRGIDTVYTAMNSSISNYRNKGVVQQDWSKEIE